MKFVDNDSSAYLKGKDVKSGDIILITNKPEFISKEESGFDNDQYKFEIMTSDEQIKTWYPNKTTLRNLAKVYGDEMDDWVTHYVRLTVLHQHIQGEIKPCVYGEPCTKEGGRYGTDNNNIQ